MPFGLPRLGYVRGIPGLSAACDMAEGPNQHGPQPSHEHVYVMTVADMNAVAGQRSILQTRGKTCAIHFSPKAARMKRAEEEAQAEAG